MPEPLEQARWASWSGHLAAPVVDAQRVFTGRNSQAWCGRTERGTRFFAKVYYRGPGSVADRLAHEVAALRFCAQHGLRCVPELIAVDAATDTLLLELIDGVSVPASSVGPKDLDAAVDFLAALHALREQPAAQPLPLAAEAFFSVGEVIENVEARFKRFAQVPRSDRMGAALEDFLELRFAPSWNAAVRRARDLLAACGSGPREVLPRSERTLSPSDFGFHNALRRRDGSLVFFDFEYFGWDDPAKTAVDFCLHPGMALAPAQARDFLARFLARFDARGALRRRIDTVWPLFGLKWCLILLNEFLREDRQRREFSAGAELDRETALKTQLDKAGAMLARVSGPEERIFHD
jgi:hypothetical protein